LRTSLFQALEPKLTDSVVGPDYISMMSGEIKNPRRVLPPAFNSIIYRIVFFYLTGALCVGIVSASDDPNLLGAIADGAPGAAKSPYIICKSGSIRQAGPMNQTDNIAMNRLEIPFLPSLINALILVSIFSTTNSFVFTASRAMFGMSQKGQAPKILGRVNKHGVPWVSVLFVLLIGCLAYLSISSTAVKFLDWWISLVGSAQLINWAGIGL
jgi:amino acid transporter